MFTELKWSPALTATAQKWTPVLKDTARTRGHNCISSQKGMVFVRQRRLPGKSPTARHLVSHCGERAPNSAEYAPAQYTGNSGHRHYWEQGFYDTKESSSRAKRFRRHYIGPWPYPTGTIERPPHTNEMLVESQRGLIGKISIPS